MDIASASILVFFCITSTYAGCRYWDTCDEFITPNTTCSCRSEDRILNQDDFEPGENCDRPCDDAPKICYFKLLIHEHSVMGPACGNCPRSPEDCSAHGCVVGNGYQRSCITVDRQMPGKPIVMCQQDILVADVINLMHDGTVTIHWHGVRQDGGAQYYDGVPFITQCPIPPGNILRYNFKASDCGTFWYHSHSGLQRPDGLLGALIVRCKNETLRSMYDHDNITVMVNDWTNVPARNLVSGFTLEKKDLFPDAILINGRTSFYDKDANITIPVAVINVNDLQSYRLRIITATSYTCAYILQIVGHRLRLITVDSGQKVKPIWCDTIMMNAGTRVTYLNESRRPSAAQQKRFLFNCYNTLGQAYYIQEGQVAPAYLFLKSLAYPVSSNIGERFDVVLTANQTPGDYPILIQGVGMCSNITSYSILHYTSLDTACNFTDMDIKCRSMFPIQRNVTCNVVDSTCNKTRCDDDKANNICMIDIDGECTPPINITDKNQCPVTTTHIIDFGLKSISKTTLAKGKFDKFIMPGKDSVFLATANENIFSLPSTTLLGTAKYNPPGTFCNETCLDRSVVNETPCQCTAIYPICLNSCVTIIARFKDAVLTHPIHLHGYNFQVAFQMGGPEFVNMTDDELKALVVSNLTKPSCRPTKDVITVPSQGVVILQFIADNPGYWFFHCHWAFHGELGMAVVFRVGTPKEHPPMPVGFPKCLNFISNCL